MYMQSYLKTVDNMIKSLKSKKSMHHINTRRSI